MHCATCNAQATETDTFCRQCGSDLRAEQRGAVADIRTPDVPPSAHVSDATPPTAETNRASAGAIDAPVTAQDNRSMDAPIGSNAPPANFLGPLAASADSPIDTRVDTASPALLSPPSTTASQRAFPRWMVWGSVAAVLSVAVVAAAILSLSGGDENSVGSSGDKGQSSRADGSGSGTPAPPSPPPPTTDQALPDVPKKQMAADIRSTLLGFHQAIVDRDFRAAWALLSDRKRQQFESEDGYAKWRRAQASLTNYLDPSAIRVHIIKTNPDTGVGQVDVRGMSWSKPGASCRQWKGLTWVKFERGKWFYDPGYSTTAQRTRAWKSRFGELLGGSC